VDGSPWDGGGDGGGEDQADEVKVGAHDEDGAAVVRLVLSYSYSTLPYLLFTLAAPGFNE
jgi:hypothetical protein